MPLYHKLGKIPQKRHTQFRQADGSLYHEQLFGTIGFDGMSSLLYHINPPTAVSEIRAAKDVSPKIAVDKNMTARKLASYDVMSKSDFLDLSLIHI